MAVNRYSASFRILSFLAVSSAIAAISWTIRDPLVAVIGIPGLAAGHFYSWRQRDVSIRRSLVLLLFMLLTVFLGGEILLSGLSDKLLLSRYLVYGLALGSFDLMRRRHIEGSLVLGGLLLVLISELALSLWFLAFLIVYVILALSAAAMSRIEGITNQIVMVGELRWLNAGKMWAGFITGTLLLSAAFFLVMPRMASGQLTANWLPSRLDLSLGGLVGLPSKPSASVSPGILGFSEEDSALRGREYVALGYSGSLADQAVMNVRSQVSSYWRGLTLSRYDGRGWLPSALQLKLQDESRQEFIFPDSRLNLTGGKVYWQAYYMLTNQPNAVFTGYNPGRLYFPRTGQTSLEKGTLYRALSVMPNGRPELLRSDSVVSEDVVNLTLPPMSERTLSLARSVVEGAATDYDKAARLERFLLTNYSYNLKVGPLPPGRDAVDYFLFEQQSGYCAHFATAMAVMSRQVGLPARVAVGYVPGFIDPITGAHVVRAGDAHAWVEIHFRRYGWVAFDPTPRPDVALGFATQRNWLYFGLERFTKVTFTALLSPMVGSVSVGRFSVPGWIWILLLIVAGAAVGLVLLFLRRRRLTGPTAIGYTVLDGASRSAMLNLYRKMVVLLGKKGLPSRHPYQPLYEYAASIGSRVPQAGKLVERLTQAASSAAYDPEPFSFETVIAARQWLRSLRISMTRLKA